MNFGWRGVLLALTLGMWFGPATARGESLDLGTFCDSDIDCASVNQTRWCGPFGLCTQCQTTNEPRCEDRETCVAGRCVTHCEDDDDCDGLEGMCNVPGGHCLQCMASTDCLDDEFCHNDFCLPDRCTEAGQFCFGDDIHTCTQDGSSSMTVETCPFGCTDEGPSAACAEAPAAASSGPGAASTGGGPATDASTGTSSATSDTGSSPMPEEEGDADKGCGCRASSSAPATAGLAALLLLGLARRRR